MPKIRKSQNDRNQNIGIRYTKGFTIFHYMELSEKGLLAGYYISFKKAQLMVVYKQIIKFEYSTKIVFFFSVC